jgi:hypothetical protein
MKRFVVAIVAASLVLTAAIDAADAKGRPADAGRARGIAEANERTSATNAGLKITFNDLIVTGKPIDVDTGENN